MQHNILLPAAILMLWTLIILLWMTSKRLPAMVALGDTLKKIPRGGRYQDIETMMPRDANWLSHNYTHLLEQPTVFYPTVILLHVAGAATAVSVSLAWGYVILRILHSLWQILVNKIPVRIVLFALSSLCLLGLAIQAVIATAS